MTFRRPLFFLLLLATCWLSCKDDDQPDNSRQANFDFVWNTIDEEYSYFDLKGVDWDEVRTELSSQVSEDMTNRQLNDLLSEMVLSLRDSHTGLSTSFGYSYYPGYRGEVDNRLVNYTRYITNITANNNRLLIGDIIGKNVKYVGVKSLSGNTDDAANDPLYNVVSSFESYDGVIIDLRNNGGGNDAIARRFVESIIDQPRTFRRYRFRRPETRNSFSSWETDQLSPDNSVSYTQPIVLLTNRYVVSSAEGFTLMLKALPNVTIMGDTTAGSTGNPGLFELPNGWELRVSRWQVTDPDGNYVEDHGIAPDQVVWISQEDRDAGRDTILEAAIAQF